MRTFQITYEYLGERFTTLITAETAGDALAIFHDMEPLEYTVILPIVPVDSKGVPL